MSKAAYSYLWKTLSSKIGVFDSDVKYKCLRIELNVLRSSKPRIKVITRNGHDVYITRDNSAQWQKRRDLEVDRGN